MSNLLTVKNFSVSRSLFIVTAALYAIGATAQARVLSCGDEQFSDSGQIIRHTNQPGDGARQIEISARGRTRTLARVADLSTGLAVAEPGMPAQVSMEQCHVRVNVRPNDGYTRSYEFRQDGIIQVVEQYDRRESNSDMPAMGFGSMMLFPRSSGVGIIEGSATSEDQSSEFTIHSGQVDFTFSPQQGGRIVHASSGIVALDGRRLAARVSQSSSAQAAAGDRGDLEIMNHPGLVLDLGFCDGHGAPHSRAAYNQSARRCEFQRGTCSVAGRGEATVSAAVVRAANGQTCDLEYTDLFDYLVDVSPQSFRAGMSRSGVSCVAQFKFSTDQAFANYIRARCPHIDVTSLGMGWRMPGSGGTPIPLGFTHPPAGSVKRVTRPRGSARARPTSQPRKASAGSAE